MNPTKDITEPIIFIGDVHGCAKTLAALVNKLPHRRICLLGDLVDRGPCSNEVIDFAINNNLDCVIGNHDHLLLGAHIAKLQADISAADRKYSPESSVCDAIDDSANDFLCLWFRNGGINTIRSYDPAFKKKWYEVVPVKHVSWIGRLPEYIMYKLGSDTVIASHTGHAYGADCIDTALWARGYMFPKDNMFRVFGHTPLKEPLVTRTYAAIDTGCCNGRKLTAYEWPTNSIWQQQCID